MHCCIWLAKKYLLQVVRFIKVAVLKVNQSFLAVPVTKVVFQLVSAAFFQCRGQKFEGFKYIYPSQRFLLLPNDVSYICGRLLRRSTHLHTKICFSVELFVVQFVLKSAGNVKITFNHFICIACLNFLLIWFKVVLGVCWWVVVSNFHKTINRSSTVFVVILFLAFIFLFSATTITYSSMIPREMWVLSV